MMVHLDHTRAIEFDHAVFALGLAVLGVGIPGFHLLKFPDRIDYGLDHVERRGLTDERCGSPFLGTVWSVPSTYDVIPVLSCA